MPSTPISLREGPLATNALVLKRYLILYFIIIWLSSLPPTILILWIVRSWSQWALPNTFITVLVLAAVVFLVWLTWVVSSLIVSRIFLSLVILIHKPREGIFERNRSDKNYRHWSLRATIRKFAFWTAHTFAPIPLMKLLAFKVLGYKQKGSGTVFFDCWIDPEFTTIEPGAKIGLGANVIASMVMADKLIVKRVRVGANAIIGVGAVVAPGADVGENCAIGALSTTELGQVLEPGWVYTGVPAKKFKLNQLDLDAPIPDEDLDDIQDDEDDSVEEKPVKDEAEEKKENTSN